MRFVTFFIDEQGVWQFHTSESETERDQVANNLRVRKIRKFTTNVLGDVIPSATKDWNDA